MSLPVAMCRRFFLFAHLTAFALCASRVACERLERSKAVRGVDDGNPLGQRAMHAHPGFSPWDDAGPLGAQDGLQAIDSLSLDDQRVVAALGRAPHDAQMPIGASRRLMGHLWGLSAERWLSASFVGVARGLTPFMDFSAFMAGHGICLALCCGGAIIFKRRLRAMIVIDRLEAKLGLAKH